MRCDGDMSEVWLLRYMEVVVQVQVGCRSAYDSMRRDRGETNTDSG